MGHRCADGRDCIFRSWYRAKVHAEKGERIVRIINTDLMAHPMNWIIIFLMLTIAAITGHMVLSLVKMEPAQSS